MERKYKREELNVTIISAPVTRVYVDKSSLVSLVTDVKADTKSDYAIPLGCIIGLLPTLVTGSFSDWLTLPKNVWQAIFIVGLIVSVIWFGSVIIKNLGSKSKLYKKHPKEIVDTFLEELDCNQTKSIATTSSDIDNSTEKSSSSDEELIEKLNKLSKKILYNNFTTNK